MIAIIQWFKSSGVRLNSGQAHTDFGQDGTGWCQGPEGKTG